VREACRKRRAILVMSAFFRSSSARSSACTAHASCQAHHVAVHNSCLSPHSTYSVCIHTYGGCIRSYSVCIRIHIHMYEYVHIIYVYRVYIHTYSVCIRTYRVCIRIHIHMYAYVHTVYVYVYINTVNVCVYIYICINTYRQNMCIYVHTVKHVHIYTCSVSTGIEHGQKCSLYCAWTRNDDLYSESHSESPRLERSTFEIVGIFSQRRGKRISKLEFWAYELASKNDNTGGMRKLTRTKRKLTRLCVEIDTPVRVDFRSKACARKACSNLCTILVMNPCFRSSSARTQSSSRRTANIHTTYSHHSFLISLVGYKYKSQVELRIHFFNLDFPIAFFWWTFQFP